MDVFWWILGSGILMSAIALVGSVTLILKETTLHRIIPWLVALAAGSLLGGAWFHMIPAAIGELGNVLAVPAWVALGFGIFLVLEQFLHWHHCHRDEHLACDGVQRKPLGYLVLIADGLHNLLGGLAVAGVFLIDIRLGIVAWIAAAAHEIPQELGDFGVLVHSGWSRARALLWNVASAATFLVGGLVAYGASASFDTTFLVPLAAGNFIYIAAADLVPEIKHPTSMRRNVENFAAFAVGVGGLALVALLFEG